MDARLRGHDMKSQTNLFTGMKNNVRSLTIAIIKQQSPFVLLNLSAMHFGRGTMCRACCAEIDEGKGAPFGFDIFNQTPSNDYDPADAPRLRPSAARRFDWRKAGARRQS